jgi:hypothetical protein
MKIMMIVCGCALVAVALYFCVPGFARTVTQTSAELTQKEMSDNWEFYYDQEVGKMEARLGDFEKARVKTIEESIRFENDMNTRSTQIADSNRMIERVAKAWRAAKEAGQDSVDVNGQTKTLAAAKDQLASWIEERKRLEQEQARLKDAVERTAALRKREAAAFQKSKAQIEALKREKAFMRSDLAVKDIELRLRELEGVSSAWGKSSELTELDKVKDVVANKLLNAEARRQLLAEESSIDKQVGLQEAIKSQGTAEQSSVVSAELDALLGGESKK